MKQHIEIERINKTMTNNTVEDKKPREIGVLLTAT